MFKRLTRKTDNDIDKTAKTVKTNAENAPTKPKLKPTNTHIKSKVVVDSDSDGVNEVDRVDGIDGVEDTNVLYNFDWLKQNHAESIKIIGDNLPSNYSKMDDLSVYDLLDKKGIIAEICIDNFVSRNLLYYPDKCALLINIVKHAVKNNIDCPQREVYKPKPKMELKEINELTSMINTRINNCINNTRKYKNDIDIINYIGFDSYKIVKFTLYQTQHVDIKPSHLVSGKEFEQFLNSKMSSRNVRQDTHSFDQKGNKMPIETIASVPQLYEIVYPQDKRTMSSQFFFHGSPIFNWYSIINNGFYVPAQHQILNGNAFGSGVYLAQDAQTSLGYMKRTTGMNIMGIAQVNNEQKYKKGSFRVVNDASDIRLKYIIVFDSDNQGTMVHQCNYLTTQLSKLSHKNDVENSGEIHNKICLKRINKEMKIFREIDKIYDFPVEISYDEKVINIWKIKITTPKDKWGEMTWEVRFDNDYPVKPPFIRIIKPNFQYLSGHITIGGAFCNPVLTNQKWRASISIPSLIEMLIVNMEEGGAKLDTKNTKPYNLTEAINAYNRYKVAHGW